MSVPDLASIATQFGVPSIADLLEAACPGYRTIPSAIDLALADARKATEAMDAIRLQAASMVAFQLRPLTTEDVVSLGPPRCRCCGGDA